MEKALQRSIRIRQQVGCHCEEAYLTRWYFHVEETLLAKQYIKRISMTNRKFVGSGMACTFAKHIYNHSLF